MALYSTDRKPHNLKLCMLQLKTGDLVPGFYSENYDEWMIDVQNSTNPHGIPCRPIAWTTWPEPGGASNIYEYEGPRD